MLHDQVELYNIHETLTGDSHALLGSKVLAHFQQFDIMRLFPTGGTDGGLWLSRLPDELRRSLNPLAQMTALDSPGGEIRLNLLGPQAAVTLQSSLGPAVAELWYGGWYAGAHIIGRGPTRIAINPPLDLPMLRTLAQTQGSGYDPALIRLILPYEPPVRLLAIEGEVCPPRADQVPQRRLLMYGSSITHGASAVRPTGTYALRTAQRLGVDLINLGFGGGAHLEPQMAAYIAARNDWDLATLELGINILDISVAAFTARVARFVDIIVAAHPDKPIYCIDVYPCNEELHGGGKAIAFREVVRAQVARLATPNVRHIAGPAVLDDLSGLSHDLTHPAPAGMEGMAANLARLIKESGSL